MISASAHRAQEITACVGDLEERQLPRTALLDKPGCLELGEVAGDDALVAHHELREIGDTVRSVLEQDEELVTRTVPDRLGALNGSRRLLERGKERAQAVGLLVVRPVEGHGQGSLASNVYLSIWRVA